MKFQVRFYLSSAAVVASSLLSHASSSYGFSASNVPTPSRQNPSSITSSESKTSDAFIFRNFAATECDDNNSPPSLKTILSNIEQLTSQGADIRGRFVDHPRLGRISHAARAIDNNDSGVPALTPFVAFCLGHAYAKIVMEQREADTDTCVTIALGRDPRQHGPILCDAFGRGAQSADKNIRVIYTGIATSPSMFHFCRYVGILLLGTCVALRHQKRLPFCMRDTHSHSLCPHA